MIHDEDVPGDLSRLVVPLAGSLETTGDLFAPYRLLDGQGVPVEPTAAFFAELTACGRPATTQRSYAMDLLRWFRFLWALGVWWDQASRVEARDFIRWLQVTVKPGSAALAGLGHFPSFGFGVNAAWLTAAMIASILRAWLKLLALDGDLAKASRRRWATASCTPRPDWWAAATNGT